MITHKTLCTEAKNILATYLATDAALAAEFQRTDQDKKHEVAIRISQHLALTLETLIGLFDGPMQREADARPEPLTLNQFQQATARTLPVSEVQHWFAPVQAGDSETYYAGNDQRAQRIDLIHAVFGVAGEAGELCDPVKKSMFYGKPLDVENIKEEAGDLLWYIAGPLCRALGCTLEELAAANVAKLRKRYPEKYSDAAAVARADKAEVGAPFDETLPKPAAV